MNAVRGPGRGGARGESSSSKECFFLVFHGFFMGFPSFSWVFHGFFLVLPPKTPSSLACLLNGSEGRVSGVLPGVHF